MAQQGSKVKGGREWGRKARKAETREARGARDAAAIDEQVIDLDVLADDEELTPADLVSVIEWTPPAGRH